MSVPGDRHKEKMIIPSISVSVIKGLGEAKRLGFPTLNISPRRAPKTFRHGVYAVYVKTSAGNFPGVAYFGPRFSSTGAPASAVFEVHCFGVSKMPRVKRFTLEFIKRLRAPKKFSTADSLKRQISRDIAKARLFCRNVI